MRRMLCVLFCLLLAWPAIPLHAAEDPQILRAWLVGCDHFVTYPNTGFGARNNLMRLRQVLAQDARGYQSITETYNQPFSGLEARELAQQAFQGANDNDISFFYISTHGIYQEGAPASSFAMLLSDGRREHALTALELFLALNPIPGAKVLVIDTCNSGALIGKGLFVDDLASYFTGGDFYVLTSAGGSEPSFLWSNNSGALQGGSYFLDALAAGISGQGRYAADENQDGDITLSEARRYLLRAYGASTPQMFPQDDDFLLLSARQGSQPPANMLTDLVYDSPVLAGGVKEFLFSFTLHRPSQLGYRLVYDQQGEWQFASSQRIPDEEGGLGPAPPGRKERALSLSEFTENTYGYVLLFVVTADALGPRPHMSTLLNVQPTTGDPKLNALVRRLPSPYGYTETAIRVEHAFPVSLTVRILNDKGEAIAVIGYDMPTRPQRLPGGGSIYYWNGMDRNGMTPKRGLYRAEVSTQVGGKTYQVLSDAFRVGF
ncbi:MAG: hypothetical protein ACOX55_13340 [Christensenellales bacterium]